MSGARGFVEATFPDLVTPVGQYTREHPGARSIAVLESFIEEGPWVTVSSLGLMDGWDSASLAALARATTPHAACKLVEDLQEGALFHFSARIPTSSFGPSHLLHLAERRLPDPWMHVENGIHTIRAPMPESQPDLDRIWPGQRVAIRAVQVPRDALRQWSDIPLALHERARLHRAAGSRLVIG